MENRKTGKYNYKAVIIFLFLNSNAALGFPSRGLYALWGELLTSSIGLRLMPIQEPCQSSSLRFLLCVKNPEPSSLITNTK